MKNMSIKQNRTHRHGSGFAVFPLGKELIFSDWVAGVHGVFQSFINLLFG